MDGVNNITLRKHKLPKTRSMESIGHSDTLSPASYDDVLGRSLDLSTNMCSSYREELKAEIHQLKTNLASTQNEMENIILENIDLKKQIAIMSQELNILKELCRSPLTTFRQNMTSSAKRSVRRRLTNSFSESPLIVDKASSMPTMDQTKDKTVNILSSTHTENLIEKKLKTNMTLQQDNIPNTCSPTIQNTVTTQSAPKQQRIYIFGTQQCTGLAINLINSRRNTNYHNYTISAFIKPLAPTEEVLKCCENIKPGKNDRIILSIGENDSNPMKMMIELSNALTRFKNTPVIVLKVFENKYLNVDMLNNHLKLICNNYTHCNFFDEPIYKFQLYSKLNNFIDYLDYKEKYLIDTNRQHKCNFSFKNKYDSQKHNNINLRNKNRKNTLMQKTIPDYFLSQSKSKNLVLKSPECNNVEFFRC